MSNSNKKNILFVDDEQGILEGIKALLRRQRGKWELHFAQSAADALDLIRKHPVDIVVSDFQMPGQSGLEFLEALKAEQPQVVRIMLSGQVDSDKTIHAISTAQQFINKPLNPLELVQLLERNVALLDYVDNPHMKKVIGCIGNLPSKTSTYNELTAILEKSSTTVKDIVPVVEKDMAITAKIMQIVNSSFFGVVKRITGLQMAMTMVGETIIRSIVLNSEVQRLLGTERFPEGWSMDILHNHSMETAVLAASIARDRYEKEQVFVAGLLHDLGLLIMASQMPEMLVSVSTVAREKKIQFWEAEYEEMGICHGEIGAYLLGLWGFPFHVVEAVAHHHRITNYPIPRVGLADLLFLADNTLMIKPREGDVRTALMEAYKERLDRLEDRETALSMIDLLLENLADEKTGGTEE